MGGCRAIFDQRIGTMPLINLTITLAVGCYCPARLDQLVRTPQSLPKLQLCYSVTLRRERFHQPPGQRALSAVFSRPCRRRRVKFTVMVLVTTARWVVTFISPRRVRLGRDAWTAPSRRHEGTGAALSLPCGEIRIVAGGVVRSTTTRSRPLATAPDTNALWILDQVEDDWLGTRGAARKPATVCMAWRLIPVRAKATFSPRRVRLGRDAWTAPSRRHEGTGIALSLPCGEMRIVAGGIVR